MLSLAAQRAAREAAWLRDPLWTRARMVPAFDIDANWGPTPVDRVSGLDLTNHTRVAPATYVDSDGTLRTATTNLLLRSEEFENASWANFQSSETANAAIAPNGLLTADKLIEESNTGVHLIQQVVTTTAAAHAFSVYLKAGERTWAFLSNSTVTNANAYFDLASGSLGTVGASATASIAPVGEGWYRCSIVMTATAAANTFRIQTANANNGLSYTGDGTSGIYIWGAQLEASSTVGEYIPTTSTQRSALRRQWDATNRRWGWLVEEARTNLLLRSEEFDNASWVKARCSITQNAIAAPNGSVTADLLIEDTSLNTHRLLATAATVAANSTVTFSVYFKSKERDQIQLYVDEVTGAGGASFSANYSASGVSGGIGTGGATYTSGSVQALGDGWYRAVITGTLAGGYTSYRCSLFPLVSGALSYQGDGTSGIYIWGAQLEAGAFPTSYIPTTGTTATRDADVWTVTGSNFSRWYNQSAGTWLAEYSTQINSFVFDATGATTAERVYLRYLSTQHQSFAVQGGATQAQMWDASATGQLTAKTAFGTSTNNFAVRSNGGAFAGAASSDQSGIMPTLDKLAIGVSSGSVNMLNGAISRLTYWPSRLSDNVLTELTR